MKLKFENLGVIKSGEIDLSKEFIILTGGNNTGKSYVSYLLYGMDVKFFTEIKNKLFEFIHTLITVEDNFPDIITKININANFKIITDKLLVYYKENLIQKLHLLYASKSINPKISLTFSEEKKIKTLKSLSLLNISNEDNFTKNTISTINGTIISKTNFFIEEYNKEKAIFLSKQYIVEEILSAWIKELNLFGIQSLKSISLRFFPAERSSINLFSKDIIQSKAKKLDEISLMSDTEKEKLSLKYNYSLAISNYLYFVNNIKDTFKFISEYSYIADEIEALIGGKVSLNEFDEMVFNPSKSKKQLDLHITSSTVKSLAGLVFYFRYYAEKNNVVFIDEPELNLHPDNQIKLARILAKVVNKGIRIVISTHSDYIIKEFNNLIMLNNDKDGKLIKKLNYNKDYVLDNNKVGAYYFPAGNNTIVEEIEVSKTGISVESIDNAIDNQDYNSDTIYYTLFEKK